MNNLALQSNRNEFVAPKNFDKLEVDMSISSSRRFNGAFVPRSTAYSSPFGRMFSKLSPWVPPGNNDFEKEQSIKTFAENNMFTDNPSNNDAIPAGYTYFGQFTDHDITFDPTSSLQRQNDPNKIKNFRTPRLDLDNLYGEGPHDEPFMYDQSKQDKNGFTGYLLVGHRKNNDGSVAKPVEDDLPRNDQGRALIGDMRNDENTIVSQLQLAFIKFHNNVMTALDNSDDSHIKDMSSEERFSLAQRLVRWTYQYIVWNDFVKRLIKDETHQSILKRKATPGSKNGTTYSYEGLFYHWKVAPYMPVEFSVAAYRLGHSMVRPGYQVNLSKTFGFGVEVPIFPFGGAKKSLQGFGPLRAEHSLQWDWFLKLKTTRPPFPQASQKIDMKLAKSLFHTPTGPNSTNPLATLNILRNWRMEVPAGSDIARAMGETPIKIDDPIEDCLWVYILKEASVANKGANSGKMLGPVGGRILGEVFAGLLYGDPLSYVRCDPNWTPKEVADLLGHKGPVNNDWELADIIVFASVEKAPFPPHSV